MSQSESALAKDGAARHLCWSCREEIGGGPFCDHCVKIQPVENLGNYFTVFGLKESFDISVPALRQKFYELSKKLHPDYFASRSKEEQNLARDNTAYLNSALRVLSDPLKRAEYLLTLETGHCGGHPTPPQDLFEEILEAGELIDTEKLSDGQRAQLQTLGENFRNRLNEFQRSLTLLFENRNRRETAERKLIETRLDNIRYIRTILSRIDKRLDEQEA